ncbi:MAG: hypothetical protein QM747_03245 [Nocardioides sp.]
MSDAERLVPKTEGFDLGHLSRGLEPHGGRVTMSFLGDDANNDAIYLVHLPEDGEHAEACRKVARTYGTLEE